MSVCERDWAMAALPVCMVISRCFSSKRAWMASRTLAWKTASWDTVTIRRLVTLLAPPTRLARYSLLTKVYGLSGLRCGWALAAPDLAEEIRRMRDLTDGVGSVVAERASTVVFGHLPELSRFLIKDNSPWLNPNGEGEKFWEEVPYWLKGYAACARGAGPWATWT